MTRIPMQQASKKAYLNIFAWPLLSWVVALLVISFVLLFDEADLLWKVQQYDLFLYTSLFFKQMMVVPGGMLAYLGAFFTQFFYYPWMGVALLCGWWWLLMWLTKRTFRIADSWSALALIPVAILLATDMNLGYWLYVMKQQGYFFVPTIGTTLAVALLWGYRNLPANLWVRMSYVILVMLVGYPLMGVYALAAALLMAVWTWRLSCHRMENAIITGVTLLALWAFPVCYYRFVYYQTNMLDLYYAALPEFAVTEECFQLYLPYYLLAACYMAFALVSIKQEPKPALRRTLQGALLIAMVAGVWHFWYKDENFHHELRMQRCLEQADWEGIVKEGKKQQSEPTRSIVMMHNLALSRLGRQCEEMYRFPKGSSRTNTALPIYMYNTAGRQIYYQYGVLNECHRMCMEQGVEYGWSVELLQYMARTSLLGKEAQATRKYLNLLRQTLFYGGWADHMEKLLDYPELPSSDKETGPITHMLHYGNILSEGDGYVEKNLMTMLSKIDSDDPYFQEQAVLGAMWTRNANDFWNRFEHYLDLHPNDPVPRIFQEAAYLFGNMAHLSFINDMPFEKNVTDNFQGFMKLMQQCDGKPRGQMKKFLFQTYGHTYYFEYFFLKDITYY